MNSIDKLIFARCLCTDISSLLRVHQEPENQFKRIQHFGHSGLCKHPGRSAQKKENPTHIGVAFDPSAHLPPRGLRAIQGTARGDTRGHPPFRTYYKGHHPRLPHSHPRSIRLRSRRRDRHARHRSRTAGHHHLYDDSRQGLRATGIGPRLHVPPQAHWWIRSDGYRRSKNRSSTYRPPSRSSTCWD